jgi:uncharacterized protein YcfJ
MKKSLAAALGLAAAVAAPLAAAQVTFYSQDGMRGQWFIADRAYPNLDPYGFNDRASSAVVQRGSWEICEHMDFGGRCVVLTPGQYPSLSTLGLNNAVSSVRPASYRPPPPQAAYAPPPPVPQPYPYYPQHGERLYEANVVAVRAVMGPPEQQCWVEQQYVPSTANVPGAIVGGVLGGVLGHQIGSGRGNDVATALGAVTGAAVGANVNRGGYTQNVQRCAAVPGTGQVSYWDVTYQFRGVYHRAQLAFQPGSTITVNGRGEPRV